jgi:membrane-associated phospholipid phosphatase
MAENPPDSPARCTPSTPCGAAASSRRLRPASFLVGSLLLFALFAVLAWGIQGDTFLVRGDQAAVQYFQDLRRDTPGWVRFFNFFTFLGGPWVILGLTVGGGLLLLGQRQFALAALWIVALTAIGPVDEWLLKEWFQRPRPAAAGESHTWSFPSGHATRSLLAYGLAAYILARYSHFPWRKWVAGGLFLVVALIGFSRVYLGRHYPTDVLGGFAFSGGCLLLLLALLESRPVPGAAPLPPSA